MITVHARRCPNSFRVVIMLEELELPYRVHHVHLHKGEHLTPEALARNPTAMLPVILDEEGPGAAPFTVFDSGAILIYLAEKAGKLYGPDAAARSQTLQWLMLQSGSVGPMFGQYAYFTKYVPPSGNEHARERYTNQVTRLLDILEYRLAQSAFLAGASYSVADITAYPWIRSIQRYGIDLEKRAALQRWYEQIAGRPPVRRATAAMAVIEAEGEAFDRENAAMASPTNLGELLRSHADSDAMQTSR